MKFGKGRLVGGPFHLRSIHGHSCDPNGFSLRLNVVLGVHVSADHCRAAPPLTALAIRFAISGVIGVGIAALIGQTARLTRRQWGAVVLFGICQNALYLGLNFVAMQWIEHRLPPSSPRPCRC